ncbi:MAG TPA: translation elongation factor Ts [Gemmataceae bacterium]|jgi:elongation factor Ts|nr:translation elongation factor Ts [Gemmataceae bacterium]
MSTPITASMVNDLRKRTDLPMMDCKAALKEAEGDLDKAVDILRVRNKGVIGKRAGNETAEGRIGVFIDNAAQVGAVVELRCESAPVAKGEHFVKLANTVAKIAAGKNPANVEALLAATDAAGKSVSDLIADTIGVLRENMKVQRFARLTGGMFGEYVHHDGTLGVLLQASGSGANPELLRDVCMHIAAIQPTPVATRREEVPDSVIAKEKEIAKAKAEATGKPAQIAEKIAEGQMKTWFAENVLLEQPFVKDQAKSVGQLLKEAGLEVTKFVRYKVGEIPA